MAREVPPEGGAITRHAHVLFRKHPAETAHDILELLVRR